MKKNIVSFLPLLLVFTLFFATPVLANYTSDNPLTCPKPAGYSCPAEKYYYPANGTCYTQTQMNTYKTTCESQSPAKQFLCGSASCGCQLTTNTTAKTACEAQKKVYDDCSNTCGDCASGYIWNATANACVSTVYTNGTSLYDKIGTAVNIGAAVWTASGNDIRNTNTGNVGIGTSSPTSLFQVTQPTTGPGTVAIASANKKLVTGTNTQFTNTFKAGDTITVSGQTARTIDTVTDQTHLMVTADFTTGYGSGKTYTLTGGNRLTVLGNGNVGIGTSEPEYLLDVDGGFRLGQSTGGQAYSIGFTRGSGTFGYPQIYNAEGNPLVIAGGVSGGGIVAIDGNVGIGTTSPDYLLEVAGRAKINSDNAGIYIEAGTNDWFIGRNGSDGTGTNLRFNNDGDKMTIEPDGDVYFHNMSDPDNDTRGAILYRTGGMALTWDADSYGGTDSDQNHGIYSVDGWGDWSDDITINSYGNVRVNIDTNDNGGTEKFSIGSNTTDGSSNTYFAVDENGATWASGIITNAIVAGNGGFTGHLLANSIGSFYWVESGTGIPKSYNGTKRSASGDCIEGNPSDTCQLRANCNSGDIPISVNTKYLVGWDASTAIIFDWLDATGGDIYLYGPNSSAFRIGVLCFSSNS